jgi:hypothetical protein
MKYKYKPGDMFEMEPFTNKGNFTEEILVIVSPTEMTLPGLTYRVYNQTFEMFMERTETFLDQFYKKVG